MLKVRYVLSLFALTLFIFFSCGDGNVTDTGGEEFSYNHEQNPGTSATDFLTDDEFDNLIVQIQYMEGYEPTGDAISGLQKFLEERLYKQSITIETEEIPATGQNSYSADEIRDLEREHRSLFSEEGTLAAYFIIVDGEFNQQQVLGIAHFNTSMALFGETIRETSDGIGQLSRSTVENIVMRHEVGHIIGLVNNGVEMQNDHQDEENGRHCDVEDCLMYYAVRTTDFFANLFGGNVPELDEYCIEDLQAAGGR